ncbi:uncharacterized protein LOC123966864 [Micropterus dolomieu]|uniref:uncharacterized protein LOC123966864 n=1 Tax=Micropterus dolomieu TaxID=147949 RepID=UPI001E8EF2FC|nr:uncharacterized protein LOC123966864 [Micropterus dolomieu]
MLKVWRIQRIHILRACLSDPEVGEGILYRYGGTLQLNYNKGEAAAVPVWIPVRGTSQQEGFHFHQAQWVTGNRVSSELFEAQAMTGVVRWNFQRLVDLKQPGVELPAAFYPILIADLNTSSLNVTGNAKYPSLQVSNRDTGERFGLQYVEPGCRPVVLNWDKNKAQPNFSAAAAIDTQQQFSAQDDVHHCPASVVDTDLQETSGTVQDDQVGALPILSLQQCPEAVSQSQPTFMPSPATAKAEPPSLVDTDLPGVAPLPLSSSPRATRTGPIKTGGLIQVLDHSRWTQPMRAAIDELLIKHHGAKGLFKQVDADYAAMVQRACTDPNSLLHPTTCQHISRYVKHLAKLKNTSSSLNTSPEKTKTVKYFYCSTKVFKTYADEGLKNPRMSFEDFAASPFFKRELEAAKQRGAEWKKVAEERAKRKTAVQLPTGRLCRFCHQPLKQGPDSPHVHTSFPKVPGKYIYCPSIVFSLYKAQGMVKKMTWVEFLKSDFYEAERDR